MPSCGRVEDGAVSAEVARVSVRDGREYVGPRRRLAPGAARSERGGVRVIRATHGAAAAALHAGLDGLVRPGHLVRPEARVDATHEIRNGVRQARWAASPEVHAQRRVCVLQDGALREEAAVLARRGAAVVPTQAVEVISRPGALRGTREERVPGADAQLGVSRA
ncbi:hypothetical protein VUR80DRAFT_8948 [Thermomyces stellatus]